MLSQSKYSLVQSGNVYQKIRLDAQFYSMARPWRHDLQGRASMRVWKNVTSHSLVDGDALGCEEKPLADVVNVYAYEEGDDEKDKHRPELRALRVG